ncbi:MAG: YlbF family regulator [Clostridia bacterium]|nr:YlbF family regulator [Clostridia bacterium]
MSKEQIFEKAKELSDLIALSDEKKEAQEASRHLMEDSEASDLISAYNEKREAKLAEYKDKEPTREEVEAINEYLQQEFNKIMENAVIREYVKASRVFEMMLTQMDNIIKQGVSVDEGGCSGSCHSCSGCHH